MKYIPNPIDTSRVYLSDDLLQLTETLAANTHDIWAQSRIQEGWIFGEAKDSKKMTTPCLVPYDQLSESEKAYDRNTAMECLKVLISLGYRIVKCDQAADQNPPV